MKISKDNAFGKAVKRALQTALYIFNVFLFAALLAQSALLLALAYSVSFAVNDSFVELLHSHLSKQGVVANENDIRINAKGQVQIRGLSLRFAGTSAEFLNADKVVVDISVFALLRGEFLVNKIYVENAKINSSEGSEKGWLLEKTSFALSNSGIWWNLEKLRAHFGRVAIRAAGTFSEKIFAQRGKDKPEHKEKAHHKTPAKMWDNFCKFLESGREYADRFGNSALVVNFDATSEGLDSLKLVYGANSVVVPVENMGDVSFENIAVMVQMSKQNISKKTAKVMLEAGYADIFGKSTLKNLDAFALVDFENKALFNAEISAVDVLFDGQRFAYADIYADKLSLADHIPTMAEIYIKRKGDFYTKLIATRSGANVSAQFNTFENPLFATSFSFMPKVDELRDFDFSEGVYLAGSADFNMENMQFFVSAKFAGKNCVFYKIPSVESYADITFDSQSGELFAGNAFVASPEGWQIKGDIYQNIKNLDYEFYIDGTLRPAAINHFMEDWWSRIMGEFEFKKGFPYANAYIKSRWGDPDFIWCFVSIKGEDALYNNHLFGGVSLKINVDPSVISIYDVDILDTDKGFAKAALCWTYDPDKGLDKYYERRVIANANMKSDALFALGGEDVDELKDVLRFSGYANIDLDLRCANLAREKDAKQNIKFKFDIPEFIDIGGFPFDSIRGIGTGLDEDFDIKDVSGVFCGGKINLGAFSVKKENKRRFFKAAFDVDGIDQQRAEDFIAALAGAKKKADEAPEKGLVDIKGTAQGYLDDFKSINGSATAELKNENLAKLNILGGISVALEKLHFPIATFKYDKLLSQVTLENGELSFQKLEINGTSSTISGKAKYNCLSDEISAKLYFKWLGGETLPLISKIASTAFNPLIGAIQIKVSNTFSDPKYSVSIKPQNIFNSDGTILEQIDADKL